MYVRVVLSVSILFWAFQAVTADICESKAKIVCYFGSWAIYREENGKFTTANIDPTLCTDIIYSFAGLDINSHITALDANADITLGGYYNMSTLKAISPCSKVILAVGGWNEGSIKYSVMASTEESRQTFADDALKFLVYYNFDGLDLDWEYPTSRGGIEADKENMVELLKVVKARLSPWGLQFSIAVGTESSYYDIENMSKYVDYIHLMAYDLTSSNSKVTGLIAPFTPVKAALDTWMQRGCPASKLVLGVPTYGRCFNLADPDDHAIGAPTTTTTCGGEYTNEDGFLAYYEILTLLENGYCQGTEISDNNVYSWCDDYWISYDNEKTVATKAKYVVDNNLAGVMVWSIDTDDFQGTYGTEFVLLNSIYKAINP